jgi:hypothetical protein
MAGLVQAEIDKLALAVAEQVLAALAPQLESLASAIASKVIAEVEAKANLTPPSA